MRVWRTSARGVFKNHGKPQGVLSYHRSVSYRQAPCTVSVVAMAATDREANTSSFEPIKDSASSLVWSGEKLDPEVGALGVIGKLTQLAPLSQGRGESGQNLLLFTPVGPATLVTLLHSG